MPTKPKSLYVLSASHRDRIYGPAERADIEQLTDVYASPQTPESVAADASVLRDAEVIFSGWGAPTLDEALLAEAPNLKAFLYGAGSVRKFVTEAFWERGIQLTSAYAANAVPVAEFTLSQILFSLKRGWHYVLKTKRDRRRVPRDSAPGAYGSTVGLISLGMVGRCVCELLRAFDVNVIVHDPFVDASVAAKLGVRLCGLDEVFESADVVSLHTPLLDETREMIRGEHFAAMKPDAAFINTARGAVVREQEMIDVARGRPDLFFILDVTCPEPPADGSELYTLDNVVLTPHIAGSMDAECHRMGRYMVEELKRYLRGEPLKWQITREIAAILA